MKNKLIASILLLSATSAFAAEPVAQAEANSYVNPYVMLMILVIVVLAAVIIVLNFSITSMVVLNKDKFKPKDSNGKGLAALAILMLVSNFAFGQDAAAGTTAVADAAAVAEPVNDGLMFGMDVYTFWTLLCVIILEIIIIIAQALIIKGYVRYFVPVEIKHEAVVEKRSQFWTKFHSAIEVEKETEIMFDHEYDGIRELDNNLPPWWKYGFYVTILFAFVYLIHYHIAKSGPSQEQEYLTEMSEGKRQVEEYLKNAADNVDENSVKMLSGSDIDAGKVIYKQNCVACHGELGEGKVGPNLTDDYWIHGGSVKDVFISIKYGWPDKGMKLWKDDLTAKQMAQVTSFVKSLRGTNPPNALPPKGDLVKE